MLGVAQRGQSSRSQRNQASQDVQDLLSELMSPDLKTVGLYQLEETLGTGAYGLVKKARHVLTNHQVAIKIMDKKHTAEIIQEIEIWRKLDHPRIAQLYEVLKTETKIYLVMELANQGELLNWLTKQGTVSEELARKWFRQVVSAISYMHKRNILHRDIKLENILLDEDLNIKLVDFGFAKEFDPLKKLDSFCGSIAYAAPEMLNGSKYKGPEVDVWSLGVVLYTMSCGQLPFEDEDQDALAAKVCAGQYVLPDNLSPELKSLIQGILRVETAERFDINQILLHPWLQMDQSDFYFNNNGVVSSPPQFNDGEGGLNPGSLNGFASAGSSSTSLSQQDRFLESSELTLLLKQAGFDTEAMLKSKRRNAADCLSAFLQITHLAFQKNVPFSFTNNVPLLIVPNNDAPPPPVVSEAPKAAVLDSTHPASTAPPKGRAQRVADDNTSTLSRPKSKPDKLRKIRKKPNSTIATKPEPIKPVSTLKKKQETKESTTSSSGIGISGLLRKSRWVRTPPDNSNAPKTPVSNKTLPVVKVEPAPSSPKIFNGPPISERVNVVSGKADVKAENAMAVTVVVDGVAGGSMTDSQNKGWSSGGLIRRTLSGGSASDSDDSSVKNGKKPNGKRNSGIRVNHRNGGYASRTSTGGVVVQTKSQMGQVNQGGTVVITGNAPPSSKPRKSARDRSRSSSRVRLEGTIEEEEE